MKEIFEYKSEEYKAKIVCETATLLMGMKREFLIAEGYKDFPEKEKMSDTASAEIIVKLSVWPACQAGSTDIDIKKRVGSGEKKSWKPVILTIDSFMQLPEALTNGWIEVVFKLNPHWTPGSEADKSEKKA